MDGPDGEKEKEKAKEMEKEKAKIIFDEEQRVFEAVSLVRRDRYKGWVRIMLKLLFGYYT